MDNARPDQFRQFIPSLFTPILLALFAGCASGPKSGRDGEYSRFDLAPVRAPFLSGLPSVFLTNLPSFSARVTLETTFAADAGRSQSVLGTLLGSENHFLFVPEKASSGSNRGRGGMGFIWSAPTASGFVLNEALQGYSPWTNLVLLTNIASNAAIGAMSSDKISGHSCRMISGEAFMNDGSRIGFTVWRADDLKAFPLRIKSVIGPTQTILDFSDVRFENIESELFSPPDGFALYPNPQAMTDELMRRQNRVGTKNSNARGDFDDSSSWTPHERGKRY